MSQAKFITPEKGTARVIIKTNKDDDLPTFEIDWIMTKASATRLMIYAIQLKDIEEKTGLSKDTEG